MCVRGFWKIYGIGVPAVKQREKEVAGRRRPFKKPVNPKETTA
jgi:hypothetical protein